MASTALKDLIVNKTGTSNLNPDVGNSANLDAASALSNAGSGNAALSQQAATAIAGNSYLQQAAAQSQQSSSDDADSAVSSAERLQSLANGGYTQSDAVTNAQNALNQILANKPGSYESGYTDQLKELYDRIMNRDKFSYDLNGDALYQQYSEQYRNAGRQAMMDTMGQAAAMTGGYGSSYASTAGNQAYQQYLTQLNNVIPELYGQARDAYNSEGDRMTAQYGLAQNADANEYARWQDAYNAWTDERNNAQSNYDAEYSRDYTDYTNRFNMQETLANMEREDATKAQTLAYNTAMSMIKLGVLPTQAMLDTAGLSLADAKAMAKKYGYGASSGGGSSKKKSSGSGTTKPTATYLPSSAVIAGVTGGATGAGSPSSALVRKYTGK